MHALRPSRPRRRDRQTSDLARIPTAQRTQKKRVLGHATASMTLDLDGHLVFDRLDNVADRLDVIGRATEDISADFLRTKGLVDPLQPKTGRPQ